MPTTYPAKIQLKPTDVFNIFPKVNPKTGKEKKMANLNGFVDAYNNFADYFGIDSPLEVAYFFSQVGHESDQFNAFEEYATGEKYEGRKDLGNVYKGDGVKFKGHGALQTTGRTNHHLANEALLKLDFLTPAEKALFKDDGVVKTPLLLSNPKWAALSAMIYWVAKDLNHLCLPPDQKVTIRRYDKVKKWYDYTCLPNEAITRKVNGGENGLPERITLFQKIKVLLKA
ncbi:MAG: hypothetical protein WBB36_15040 [Chitinophagales bacterium]